MGKKKHSLAKCVGKNKLLELVSNVEEGDGERFASPVSHKGLSKSKLEKTIDEQNKEFLRERINTCIQGFV